MHFTSVQVDCKCYRALQHIFSSLEAEVTVHTTIAHSGAGYTHSSTHS